jgi:hypothetical protein
LRNDLKQKMMNRKIVANLLISAGLLLSACQKNSDIFVPDPGQTNGPDTSWYSTITSTMPVTALQNVLATEVYTDSIQVNSNTAYILTPFGLQCGFPPNCCVGTGGQAITGTVQVELLLVKKKGDLVRLNKPTTSNGRLLISGGQVFIRLKKNNQELQLAPNVKILFRYADLPISLNMKLFFGDESNPQQFNWLPNNDIINNSISPTTQNYEIQTNHLRWIGVDSVFDTTGISLTTISVSLAPQFTNANTTAFVVFKDFRSVVGMTGNTSTRKFTSIKLPVGREVTVVVISKQGNAYFMDHKSLVTAVASSPGNQTVAINPVITSLANITTYLDSLQ